MNKFPFIIINKHIIIFNIHTAYYLSESEQFLLRIKFSHEENFQKIPNIRLQSQLINSHEATN